MANIKPTSAAKLAGVIIADLENRTGFKELFRDISAGVKNEIHEKIANLIVDERESAEESEGKEPKDSKSKK